MTSACCSSSTARRPGSSSRQRPAPASRTSSARWASAARPCRREECDLIVAEEGTQFQITETSRGLGAGKYWALMHYRGGGAFTMEAALTGRFFTAEEAFKANLINRVAPKGKYLEVARELADRCSKTRRSACARRCACGATTWIA